MRKTLYLFLGFALIVSTAKGLSTSTDCQRWVSEYKTALAQKTSTQHLLAARNRARAAARRRLAKLTTRPAAPHPTRISSVRPHLSPAQMLKRFDLACGELPVENAVADERMAADDFISEVALGGPLETENVPLDGTLIAENAPPVLTLTGVNTQGPEVGAPFSPIFGPVFGGPVSQGPVFGGVGGGGVPISPGAPGQGGPTGGPTTGSPGVPSAPVPPISAVPEPSSILLTLTGMVGGLAFATRRS